MSAPQNLLSGVRVIESSLLGPGHVATFFADLGADVIKVEPPSGDYIREMTCSGRRKSAHTTSWRSLAMSGGVSHRSPAPGCSRW